MQLYSTYPTSPPHPSSHTLTTHKINELLEMEKHPHVSLSTPDESKPIPQSRNHTLIKHAHTHTMLWRLDTYTHIHSTYSITGPNKTEILSSPPACHFFEHIPALCWTCFSGPQWVCAGERWWLCGLHSCSLWPHWTAPHPQAAWWSLPSGPCPCRAESTHWGGNEGARGYFSYSQHHVMSVRS